MDDPGKDQAAQERHGEGHRRPGEGQDGPHRPHRPREDARRRGRPQHGEEGRQAEEAEPEGGHHLRGGAPLRREAHDHVQEVRPDPDRVRRGRRTARSGSAASAEGTCEQGKAGRRRRRRRPRRRSAPQGRRKRRKEPQKPAKAEGPRRARGAQKAEKGERAGKAPKGEKQAKGAEGAAGRKDGGEGKAEGRARGKDPPGYKPRLKALYLETVAKDLKEEFGYKSVMQIPRLSKIVVSMGLGEAIENKKLLDSAAAEIDADHRAQGRAHEGQEVHRELQGPQGHGHRRHGDPARAT